MRLITIWIALLLLFASPAAGNSIDATGRYTMSLSGTPTDCVEQDYDLPFSQTCAGGRTHTGILDSPLQATFTGSLLGPNNSAADDIELLLILTQPTPVTVTGWADLFDGDPVGSPSSFRTLIYWAGSGLPPLLDIFVVEEGRTEFSETLLLDPGEYEFYYVGHASGTSNTTDFEVVVTIPEPSTALLALGGLLALGLADLPTTSRTRRRSAAGR